MKFDTYQKAETVTVKDLNREPAGKLQKQPWQTPKLYQADYDITSAGNDFGGDGGHGFINNKIYLACGLCLSTAFPCFFASNRGPGRPHQSL